MTKKNLTKRQIIDLKKRIPLGCLGKPQDIAELVYFLCSDKNLYITGQDVIIDGGYSVGGFEK
jgi:3-oxoacyl-[acyl-carrier protein] reductase